MMINNNISDSACAVILTTILDEIMRGSIGITLPSSSDDGRLSDGHKYCFKNTVIIATFQRWIWAMKLAGRGWESLIWWSPKAYFAQSSQSFQCSDREFFISRKKTWWKLWISMLHANQILERRAEWSGSNLMRLRNSCATLVATKSWVSSVPPWSGNEPRLAVPSCHGRRWS